MCNPALAVGVATLVTGAVSSIASYQTQNAQARASQKVYEQQRLLDDEAANVGYQKSQLKYKAEKDKADQTAQNLMVQRLQTQGTTLAAGRGGQSIGGLLTDAQRVEGKDLATLGMNLASSGTEYGYDVLGIFTEHKSARAQAASKRTAKASTGGLIANLGVNLMSSVNAYTGAGGDFKNG
jgi:opacity protein-like surface antigen